MNYFFAGLILGVWFFLQMGLQWSSEHKTNVNVVYSIGTFLILGVIYWVPFWLIFFKIGDT